MSEKIGIWEVSDDVLFHNCCFCICIHLDLALGCWAVGMMVAHSIIVLMAFLSCIVGPIIFAVQVFGTDEDEKESVDHHFLKG
jgi:hypothetical protein